MATITIGHLIDMALDQVQDEDRGLWDYQDLINWYNFGTRQIVSIDPRANPITVAMKLAIGIKQTIPPGGIALLNVIRNMGVDGETPGRAIVQTTLEALSRSYPSYSTETASATIYNWMPDVADKTIFRVYPPADGTSYGEIVYGKVPTILVYDAAGDWQSALIGVKENYVDPLMNYLLSRAFGKDTDIPGNIGKAALYYGLFLTGMGLPAPAQRQRQAQGG